MKRRMLISATLILTGLYLKAQINDTYFPQARVLKHKIKCITIRDCLHQDTISKTAYNSKGNKTYQIDYNGGSKGYFYKYDSSGNVLRITYSNGDIADKFTNSYDKNGRLIKAVWHNREYCCREFRKIIYRFKYDDQNKKIMEKKKTFDAHSFYKEKDANTYSYEDSVKTSPTGIYWHLPDPANAKYNSNGLIVQSGSWCYEYEYY